MKSGSLTENEILSRNLFGNQFLNILRSITLFHPFWTGAKPQWFVVQQIPFYFWLIPIFAFGGLLLNRKNKYILFFGIISLIGILLAKQVGEPFSGLYSWLFDYMPGFNAFREASKFYFIIALGYSVLIGAFVDWIWENWKENKWQIYGKYFLIFLIAFLFLLNTKPLITGEIETLFVPRNVPDDYFKLKDFILSQDDYFRTLYTPTYSRWGIYTNKHPMISNVNTIQSDWKYLLNQQNNWQIQNQIIDTFKQPISNNLLDDASIKYVIVPIRDIQNDDDFFVYYGNDRQFYIDELEKIDYLKKINIGTENIVVYENENYRPHIYRTFERETVFKNVQYQKVDFQFKNPTEYKIVLKNIKKREYLVFSEKYHPEWNIGLEKDNSFSENFLPEIYHSETDAGFNSFLVDPEYIKAKYSSDYYQENDDGSIDIELLLQFQPQSSFYIGLIISSATFIGCMGYLIYRWQKGRTN